MNSQRTFRELDGTVLLLEPSSALEQWYLDVRDIPMTEMGVFDLARSCRQRLYLGVVVPICMDHLKQDPLAGELFDGELLLSLKGLPEDFWRTHPDEWRSFLACAEQAYEISGDPDLRINPVP